jgi:putative DNA primase/helicase
VNAAAIPVELRERAQWVVWKRERRAGKPTKVPYRAADARTKAAVDDPRTWGTFEQAIARVAEVQGIGYMFSADDPFCGVDLDACIDAHGELHAAAGEILAQLGGYQEPSPSGTGMHAIVAGKLAGDRHRTGKTPWGGQFEVYDQGRFFTVTGNGSGAIVERQAQLDALVERMLGKPSANGNRSRGKGQPAGESPDDVARGVLDRHADLGKVAARKGPKPKDVMSRGCSGVWCVSPRLAGGRGLRVEQHR